MPVGFIERRSGEHKVIERKVAFWLDRKRQATCSAEGPFSQWLALLALVWMEQSLF